MKTRIDKTLSVASLFRTLSIAQNVYVHLPFCKKKCHFCAFPIHAVGLHPQHELFQQYVDALKSEINISRSHLSLNSRLKSLYFGGGTPSLHSLDHFSTIIRQLPISANTEITAEVNPTQMDSMQGLLDLGVNRISLGIQSFNSSILQSMGRHAPDNSLPFIMNGLSKCRPPNLNTDFILNFCSSNSEWEEMTEFIKQVLPQHLTIYILQVNEGSKLYSQPQLLSQLPPEEEVVSRYIELCSFLKQIGYQHYEICNFSRADEYRSQHSSTYWHGDKQYLAYGMGATSLTSNRRITRPRSISKYMQYVQSLSSGSVPLEFLEIEEEITIEQKLSTVILSGIRTAEGISWAKLKAIDIQGQYVNKIRDCLLEMSKERPEIISHQYIGEGIRLLSPYGFLLGDEIGFRLIQAIQDKS